MLQRYALCRAVSPAIAHCELSFIGREPIDFALAQLQHRNYMDCLRMLGAIVVELPAEPALPDSVFVEDTALMFDELVVTTRPGAVSRRDEVASVAAALMPYRKVVAWIEQPATLDGGDVLCIGKQVYVGQSQRSNLQAVEQLRDILTPFGYCVTSVPMRDCLHLKSAVTALADDVVLINPDWVDAGVFSDYRQIEVAADEPHAANVMRVNGCILMPSNFPMTCKKIQAEGFTVHVVNVSELQKAEGAVTCCSVLFDVEVSAQV